MRDRKWERLLMHVLVSEITSVGMRNTYSSIRGWQSGLYAEKYNLLYIFFFLVCEIKVRISDWWDLKDGLKNMNKFIHLIELCYLFGLISHYFGWNIFSTKLVKTNPKWDIKKPLKSLEKLFSKWLLFSALVSTRFYKFCCLLLFKIGNSNEHLLLVSDIYPQQ